jgi:hypothetical protein
LRCEHIPHLLSVISSVLGRTKFECGECF